MAISAEKSERAEVRLLRGAVGTFQEKPALERQWKDKRTWRTARELRSANITQGADGEDGVAQDSHWEHRELNLESELGTRL